jgi:hypothetical protein
MVDIALAKPADTVAYPGRSMDIVDDVYSSNWRKTVMWRKKKRREEKRREEKRREEKRREEKKR